MKIEPYRFPEDYVSGDSIHFLPLDCVQIKKSELEEILKAWLHTYASDCCDEERVKHYQKLITDNGGTIAYLASKFKKFDIK